MLSIPSYINSKIINIYKVGLLLTVLFSICLIGCTNERDVINTEVLKSKQDALPFDEIVLEMSVNEFDEIIDTISTSRVKFNKDGEVLYSEKTWVDSYGNSFSKQYKYNNVVYFQEVSLNDNNSYSLYKAELIEPGIENAIVLISNSPESNDTMKIDIVNSFNLNGNLKKSISTWRNDEDTTQIYSYFNQSGKLNHQLQKNNNKITEEWKLQYDNKVKLISSNRVNFYGDTLKSNFTYNQDEKILKVESRYGESNHTIKDYKYNENGKLEYIISNDMIENKTETTKFLYKN